VPYMHVFASIPSGTCSLPLARHGRRRTAPRPGHLRPFCTALSTPTPAPTHTQLGDPSQQHLAHRSLADTARALAAGHCARGQTATGHHSAQPDHPRACRDPVNTLHHVPLAAGEPLRRILAGPPPYPLFSLAGTTLH